jgi:hypothetical protein
VTRLQTISAFLNSQTTMGLATVRDGGPRVTPLYYLADEDLRLYWFSSSRSEHSRSLRKSARVAVAVYRHSGSWREIRGVQMRGVAREVEDAERRRVIEQVYAARFGVGKLLRASMAKCKLYVFEPDWARYIDNSRRFGYKFEIGIARPDRVCARAASPR